MVLSKAPGPHDPARHAVHGGQPESHTHQGRAIRASRNLDSVSQRRWAPLLCFAHFSTGGQGREAGAKLDCSPALISGMQGSEGLARLRPCAARSPVEGPSLHRLEGGAPRLMATATVHTPPSWHTTVRGALVGCGGACVGFVHQQAWHHRLSTFPLTRPCLAEQDEPSSRPTTPLGSSPLPPPAQPLPTSQADRNALAVSALQHLLGCIIGDCGRTPGSGMLGVGLWGRAACGSPMNCLPREP